MNKAELIEEIAKKTCLSKKDATSMLEAFMGTVSEALTSGEEVKLTGFGKFEVVHKAASKGRNPHTGETVTIPEKLVPKFRVSGSLKNLINE